MWPGSNWFFLPFSINQWPAPAGLQVPTGGGVHKWWTVNGRKWADPTPADHGSFGPCDLSVGWWQGLSPISILIKQQTICTSITPMLTPTSIANAASHSFSHRSPPPVLNAALAFCNLSHNVPLSRRLEEPVQKHCQRNWWIWYDDTRIYMNSSPEFIPTTTTGYAAHLNKQPVR